MKKHVFRKFIVFALALVMIAGAFVNLREVSASAKSAAPGKPKVKITALKEKKGIKVTIGKTKNADGFKVYVYFGSDESLYTIDDKPLCVDNMSFEDYKNVASVDQNGKKKRTVSIKASSILGSEFETLYPGTYFVKVKAYKKDAKGKMTYGKLSKEVKLKVSVDTKTGRTSAGYSIEDIAKLKQGDIVTFGAYEQDCNFANGPEPIEWIVLSKKDSQIFLFSKYALDRLPYDTTQYKKCIWKVSSIRKWLNKKFYDVAFSEAEKAFIATVTNENPYYITEDKTVPGTDTKDKVFLLSEADVNNEDYGLDGDLRACVITEYAKVRGADPSYCDYWLRTLGDDEDGGNESCASTVNYRSYVSSLGMCTYFDYEYDNDEDYGLDISYGSAVRPAIVIDLKKSGDDHWAEEWDDEWNENDYWDGFEKNFNDDEDDDFDDDYDEDDDYDDRDDDDDDSYMEETGQTVKGCVIDATFGVVNSEGGINLLDDDKYTKFCFMAKSGYIIWEAPEKIEVKSYVLMTGNDTSKYTGRNPKSWVLYGANKELSRESEEWEVVHSVSNSKKMKAKDYKEYTFELEAPAKAYKFYKLEILENKGDVCTQLSELTLNAK